MFTAHQATPFPSLPFAVCCSAACRYGLYVAEVLHARVLPLQFISFADSWTQVEAAAQSSVIIAGQDGGFNGLWLWWVCLHGEQQEQLQPLAVAACATGCSCMCHWL